MAGVDAERARPLHREDTIQALAGNGRVTVAGLQDGAILVSRDKAATWSRVAIGPASIIALSACPDGSFAGLDFYKKLWLGDAQGGHWQAVAAGKGQPLALTCAPDGRLWTAGAGSRLQVSADKGASWTSVDFDDDFQFTAIGFVDQGFGYAAGEFGAFYVTRDGGASWQAMPPAPDEFYPYDAVFTSRDEGWMSGIGGRVLHTADGGGSWSSQANDTGAAFYHLVPANGAMFGVGAFGVVARLRDGAWQGLAYADARPVELQVAIPAAGQERLVIGGPGGLLRTIDTN